MFGGMPSQEQQKQMFQQYQDQMKTFSTSDTSSASRTESSNDTSPKTQETESDITQNKAQDTSSTTCSKTVSPVCGTDQITYANECLAIQQGTSVAYEGKCSQTQQNYNSLTTDSVKKAVTQKKTAKKKQKKSAPISFQIGPGPDRQVIRFSISGTGDLNATLQWTGTAQALEVQIAPQAMPGKDENNDLGYTQQGPRRARVVLAQYQYQSGQQFSSEEMTGDIDEEDLASGAFTAQQQGPSPVTATLPVDEDTPTDLIVTIVSFEGEATGTLELGGDVSVSQVLKDEFDSSGLNPAGKIIVPLVLYQLDRYFKNPAQKNTFETKFANHITQLPLAQNKLKVAVNRYNAFSLAKKKSLFNSAVVTSLDSAKGQALSSKKITEIKNLLQSTLPPSTPTEMSGSVTWTDPDAETGGKILKLQWKHAGLFTSKYSIERAPAQIIEQILNIDTLQFEPYAEMKKRGGWGKGVYRKFQKLVSFEDYPNLYCYRVRAWNAKGYSDYTDHFCPEVTGISTVSSNFNVKWAYLHSNHEADVDGFSNSDEPYLLFSMINGKNADGTAHTWVRKWDAADDVDSGETEPDDERASFTLFGEPPADAALELANLKTDLASTQQYLYQGGAYMENPAYTDILNQIRNHEWGSKHIRNDNRPIAIDLHTGLMIATTIMEEDAGANISVEEQIKAGIQAAKDIIEAFMDPSGISAAIAIKSTLEFMYKMWANDDYVGTESWHLSFTNANELVNPPNSSGAYLKELDIDGGGDGHYTVGMCLYRENTVAYAIQQGCQIGQ